MSQTMRAFLLASATAATFGWRGDRYLRTLMIHGARAALGQAGGKQDPRSRWLGNLRGAARPAVEQSHFAEEAALLDLDRAARQADLDFAVRDEEHRVAWIAAAHHSDVSRVVAGPQLACVISPDGAVTDRRKGTVGFVPQCREGGAVRNAGPPTSSHCPRGRSIEFAQAK